MMIIKTLSVFKAKIKSLNINNCPCKIFVKDLGFVEVVRVPSGIHTNVYSSIFFFNSGNKVLK